MVRCRHAQRVWTAQSCLPSPHTRSCDLRTASPCGKHERRAAPPACPLVLQQRRQGGDQDRARHGNLQGPRAEAARRVVRRGRQRQGRAEGAGAVLCLQEQGGGAERDGGVRDRIEPEGVQGAAVLLHRSQRQQHARALRGSDGAPGRAPPSSATSVAPAACAPPRAATPPLPLGGSGRGLLHVS